MFPSTRRLFNIPEIDDVLKEPRNAYWAELPMRSRIETLLRRFSNVDAIDDIYLIPHLRDEYHPTRGFYRRLYQFHCGQHFIQNLEQYGNDVMRAGYFDLQSYCNDPEHSFSKTLFIKHDKPTDVYNTLYFIDWFITTECTAHTFDDGEPYVLIDTITLFILLRELRYQGFDVLTFTKLSDLIHFFDIASSNSYLDYWVVIANPAFLQEYFSFQPIEAFLWKETKHWISPEELDVEETQLVFCAYDLPFTIFNQSESDKTYKGALCLTYPKRKLEPNMSLLKKVVDKLHKIYISTRAFFNVKNVEDALEEPRNQHWVNSSYRDLLEPFLYQCADSDDIDDHLFVIKCLKKDQDTYDGVMLYRDAVEAFYRRMQNTLGTDFMKNYHRDFVYCRGRSYTYSMCDENEQYKWEKDALTTTFFLDWFVFYYGARNHLVKDRSFFTGSTGVHFIFIDMPVLFILLRELRFQGFCVRPFNTLDDLSDFIKEAVKGHYVSYRVFGREILKVPKLQPRIRKIKESLSLLSKEEIGTGEAFLMVVPEEDIPKWLHDELYSPYRNIYASWRNKVICASLPLPIRFIEPNQELIDRTLSQQLDD